MWLNHDFICRIVYVITIVASTVSAKQSKKHQRTKPTDTSTLSNHRRYSVYKSLLGVFWHKGLENSEVLLQRDHILDSQK
jgi:hypothetical protein